MIEVLVLLAFLFSLWIFGRSLIIACSASGCDWLTIPIGFCLVGLISNIFYFTLGLTVQSMQVIFLCALLPCLFIIFLRGVHRDEWYRLAAVIGVFLLLALPAWIGGEQYYVFRGNHWDQFSYIDITLTFWDNPYHTYQHILANGLPINDVLANGTRGINARPAVNVVGALALPNGIGNIHLLAFLYATALWAMVFSAACFAWKRILESYKLDTSKLLLLIVPPFAYVVGFWGQYIFDINAWSQMASLSLLLAFIIGYIRLLQKLADPLIRGSKSIVSEYVIVGLLAAGAFLFCPENASVQVMLLLVATVLWWIVVRKAPRFIDMLLLVAFSIVVLLIASIPNWGGTVNFLIQQTEFGIGQNPTWWDYFDRYWFGIHSGALFSQIQPAVSYIISWQIEPTAIHGPGLFESFDKYWAGVHIPSIVGYISIFSNLILGSIGMFFVTPDYSIPSLWLLYTWISITVILAALAIYSLSVSLFVRLRNDITTTFLKIFFLSGIVFLSYLFTRGSLWSFGKGLAYLSPYLFLVLCLGLVEASRKTKDNSKCGVVFSDTVIKWFVIIFIISQIAFGVARLYSARDPNGIGYDNAIYPSNQDNAMKTLYLWNMDPSVYKHCKGVQLLPNKDTDPFYIKYVKQKLVYLKVPHLLSTAGKAEDIKTKEVQQPIFTDCNAGFIKFQDTNKWVTVKK